MWVCQVKCVSSFLHLFPQLSAVWGAERNSGHGGDLFVGIGGYVGIDRQWIHTFRCDFKKPAAWEASDYRLMQSKFCGDGRKD